MNHWGKRQFRAFSAGSRPKGEVHPVALELIRRMGWPTEGLRSKSWNEFSESGALHLDFAITVCDKAAAEVCPVWPGQPMSAHWGMPDPAAVEGNDVEKNFAFRQAFNALEMRVKLFLSLPIASIDRLRLKERMEAIGKTPPPQAKE